MFRDLSKMRAQFQQILSLYSVSVDSYSAEKNISNNMSVTWWELELGGFNLSARKLRGG